MTASSSADPFAAFDALTKDGLRAAGGLKWAK